MEKILVVAEHHHGKLSNGFLCTLSAAFKISNTCDVLIMGDSVDAVAQQCATLNGIDTVYTFSHPVLSHPLAEHLAQIVLAIAKKEYTTVMAASTTFGKNFMPRVAALLDVPQISDVAEIVDAHTFVRPIYAGNAFEKLSVSAAIRVLTIRPTAFEAANFGGGNARIQALSFDLNADVHIEYETEETPELSRPELTAAKVVVSGGRGLGSAENFKHIEHLADQLNAAVGASRAAVDAGYVPNDFQVGQTGKIVAPDLYIAVGISGAIQHIAGMKDSKVIVAINKDPEAPIFQLADYGLVGDLFEILPQLAQSIKALKT